jgi:hypothetical protein
MLDYGAANVEVDENGYLVITKLENDNILISKEMFIMMINAINDGIHARKMIDNG